MEEQFLTLMFKVLGPWVTMIGLVVFTYLKLRAGNLIVLQNGSKKNGGKKTAKETEAALCKHRLNAVEKRLDKGDTCFIKHSDAINRIDCNVAKLLGMAEERKN